MFQVVVTQPRVVVAFHSGYGHSAVLAEAVQRGAEKAGADLTLIAVDAITDEQWHQLDTADAVVFGSPTYMGGVSAGFHAFAEASSGRYLNGTWADKIAAGFTNSASKSGDKLNTLNFLTAQTPQDGVIKTVHEADIATAEHLGTRVAAQAMALPAGRAALAEVTA